MTIAQRKLLIAVLALFCSAAVVAADAPNDEPAKADQKDEKPDDKKGGREVKAEPPAGADLPSKPYPANASPKAFQPKKEAAPKADAGPARPVEKMAERPADKTASNPANKAADKQAADKQASDRRAAAKPTDANRAVGQDSKPQKAVKKPRAGYNAQVKARTPPTNPAMQDLAREVAGRQPNANAQSYVVQARDNLDSVIRKTLPSNLFSADVLRQAYLRANPALVASANVRLRKGQVLQVPDAATVRSVITGEGGSGYDQKPDLFIVAPVVAPTVAATTYELNTPVAIPRLPVNAAGSANLAPEVSSEEKKKWVRYP
jgi:hypothetical protein